MQGAKAAEHPTFVEPQLAVLAGEIPVGSEWLHEIKYDGYRFQCHLRAGQVKLITRQGNDWTARFPGVASAIAQLDVADAVFDGEVVVLESDGTSNFQLLQNALSGPSPANLYCYLFDLPYCNGYDLRRVPLSSRKQLLKQIIEQSGAAGILRFSDHIVGEGPAVFTKACQYALEGVISKLGDSPYEGGRSGSWVKTKCVARQDFVVAGFTDPEGSREKFGALLLGCYDDGGALEYCGRVGTGFNRRLLNQLFERLDGLRTERNPFKQRLRGIQAKGVHFIRPELVAEVEFANFTADGIARQASFKGIREDIDPKTVRRDVKPARPGPERGKEKKSMPTSPSKTAAGASIEVAGVRLSSPERVLFPEQGLTKRELAEFYVEIADWILPYVVDRPLSLVRCPQGQGKKCFFQKHHDDSLPEAVLSFILQEQEGDVEPYIRIDSLAGLVSLVQLGALELHPWGSRVEHLEQPDQIIFDLDPDEGITWQDVVGAARAVRERLEELGLQSFVKTSGGKGLHVVAPLEPLEDWETVAKFSGQVAAGMARREPERFTATMSKAKRKGKIFIDHFRNARGSTSVAAYSTRARPGAPVSTPIRWDELAGLESAQAYTVANLPRRLRQLKQDPWAGFLEAGQRLTDAMKKEAAKR